MEPSTLSNTASRSNYFGVCPTCRRQNGCHSLGPVHWYVCDIHKVKWNVGTNLFSTWRNLTPDERSANEDKLAEYREVEPFSLLKHGTATEIATYHAGVEEVQRIAEAAGFSVDIWPHRDIPDPLEELSDDTRPEDVPF